MEYIDGHMDLTEVKQTKNNNNSITKVKEKMENLIDINCKPEDVTISTMTITCKLGTDFNVENICKYIDLSRNGVIEVVSGKDTRTLITKKCNNQKNKKGKREFYNQITLKVNTKKDKVVNIKLFINGSIQMTGCKSVEGSIEALEKLLESLKKEKAIINTETMKIEDKPFMSNASKLNVEHIHNYKVAMINSNFTIGFSVDRLKLFNCMTKDGLDATYDPIIHAGVIIRYNTGEKIISIFVFESGSIVITGAKGCVQINSAYNFINKYLLENYKNIVKSNNLSNSTILKYLDADINS
ncbi:TATA box binding protein [Catovirus CTV1]|uniref:TATA box binding protein n=1 Tax=Catovirus CTV1 TaxID=1977631 RepID=A0A1V0SC99_9VIRU|nr:TATA box binding protein [Catovirus CTV1]